MLKYFNVEKHVSFDRMSILSVSGSAVKDVLKLFRLLFFINVIMIFAAVLLYPGKFPVLTYPISDLGATRALNGDANTPSMLILISGMVISSILMFKAAFRLEKERARGPGRAMFFLTMLCGFGYILLTAPDDIMDTVHRWGGALTVGSLWAITIIMLEMLRSSFGIRKFIIFHYVLHVTVIIYAICFFLDLYVRDMAQKAALLALGTIWILCVNGLSRSLRGEMEAQGEELRMESTLPR